MSKHHRHQPPAAASQVPNSGTDDLTNDFSQDDYADGVGSQGDSAEAGSPADAASLASPQDAQAEAKPGENEKQPEIAHGTEEAQKTPISDEKPPETAGNHPVPSELPPAQDSGALPAQAPRAAEDEHEADALASSPPISPTALADVPPPIEYITITIPVCAPPVQASGGYQSKRRDHVEAQLTKVQGEALRHLFRGLDLSNARLANGALIRQRPDAVRILLDMIGAQLPACQKIQRDLAALDQKRRDIRAGAREAKEARETSVA